MTVGSLFSGIGGFDLGLERAGHEILWQVENDPYCQKVLAKHWPDIPCHGDIHDVGSHNLEKVDIICGGFPCQPVSVAGKRKGQDDERWLWPEFGRLICELRPRYVLVENVPGLLVRGMGDVLGDLSEFGYDAEWGIVSAASVGAPHLRKRIFIVAHARELRCESRGAEQPLQGTRLDGQTRTSDLAHANGPRSKARRSDAMGTRDRSRRDEGLSEDSGGKAGEEGKHWAVEPDVGRVAHGVPSRVDRLKGLGNAIVPQVAEWIGRRVQQMEIKTKTHSVSRSQWSVEV